MQSTPTSPITLFLCGDVMTGRGVDQVLPHPNQPDLYEPWVRDARDYVQLAEEAHGPIPRLVEFAYLWGDALAELERTRPAARIINLETSITSSEDFWPGKGIHYRMHPQNVGCLTSAHIDCCCLANNHVLDWSYPGLAETLRTLDRAGLAHAGAGRNLAEAAAPVVLPAGAGRRVLVFAFGGTTSGIPPAWAATKDRPGIHLLENLSVATARRVAHQMQQFSQPGDVLVASIHWGDNWGYDIPTEQIHFAQRLIDEGVAIVHGHSSHHVKAIEVYRGRLILHGCGDFLTDYEGIGGHEMFRGDLVLMYLVAVELDGRLVEVRLVPLQSRRFRLTRVAETDAQWLCRLLNEQGAPFGTQVQLQRDNSLSLRWRDSVSSGSPAKARSQWLRSSRAGL